jgi:hypothetical protein
VAIKVNTEIESVKLYAVASKAVPLSNRAIYLRVYYVNISLSNFKLLIILVQIYLKIEY